MYRFYPSKGVKVIQKAFTFLENSKIIENWLINTYKFETSKENQYLSICRPKTEELKRKYVAF